MHVTLLWSEKWCELVVTTAFLLVTYVLNLPELFLDQKWCIQVTGPIGLLRIIPVSQFFFTPAQMLSSSNQWAATFLQIFFFKSISRGGGVFSQATLRDLANCSREVSSSNQLSATFLEMHLLQMSKDLNSWDLTASPGYWPLITSWWKFKMLSSPINFHCFTGSEKSVDSHLSMSIGESAKEVTFLQMCWGWRGGGRGGVKIHL